MTMIGIMKNVDYLNILRRFQWLFILSLKIVLPAEHLLPDNYDMKKCCISKKIENVLPAEHLLSDDYDRHHVKMLTA